VPSFTVAVPDLHIQSLVGRDVLSQAVLVYIGYTNQFTMSF
jgi:hypothetical protein